MERLFSGRLRERVFSAERATQDLHCIKRPPCPWRQLDRFENSRVRGGFRAA